MKATRKSDRRILLRWMMEGKSVGVLEGRVFVILQTWLCRFYVNGRKEFLKSGWNIISVITILAGERVYLILQIRSVCSRPGCFRNSGTLPPCVAALFILSSRFRY